MDAYPVHLLNLASVRDVAAKVKEEIPNFSARRFRSNILLTGPSAYDEDDWKRIRIDNEEFHCACRTVRCKLLNVDPDLSERHPLEPDKTLKRFRCIDDGGLNNACLGLMLVPVKEKRRETPGGSRRRGTGAGEHSLYQNVMEQGKSRLKLLFRLLLREAHLKARPGSQPVLALDLACCLRWRQKKKTRKRKYRSSTLQLQDRHAPKLRKALHTDICHENPAVQMCMHLYRGTSYQQSLATRSKCLGRRATLHGRSAASDLARRPCPFQGAKRRTGGVDM